jgi:hypothetical protein
MNPASELVVPIIAADNAYSERTNVPIDSVQKAYSHVGLTDVILPYIRAISLRPGIRKEGTSGPSLASVTPWTRSQIAYGTWTDFRVASNATAF